MKNPVIRWCFYGALLAWLLGAGTTQSANLIVFALLVGIGVGIGSALLRSGDPAVPDEGSERSPTLPPESSPQAERAPQKHRGKSNVVRFRKS